MVFYKTELYHHYKGEHNQKDHGNWADTKRYKATYQTASKMEDDALDDYNKRSAKIQAYVKNKEWEKQQVVEEKDPFKQAEEGIKSAKTAVDSAKKFLGDKPTGRERVDLSEMTDDELRKAIQREQLELNYSNYFGTPKKEAKAKAKARKFLEVSGVVLTVGLTGVQLMAAINALQKQKNGG